MKKQLKVIELFAGIGAPRKALMRGGYNFEIVDAIEIDKYAVKSYNAMYGENIEIKNICEYFPKKEDVGEIDLLFHGSPCQDFSLAGKQAGGDKDSGTRSSLMYETIRIVEELKPKYVVWENVKNLLSKKHRHNFDAYLETMTQLGYTNYYQVLNAKDYGIPQNRERVFTISILGNEKYDFPKVQELEKIPLDFIEKNVDKKYDLTDKNIKHYQREFGSKGKELNLYEPIPTLTASMGTGGGNIPYFTFPPKQELRLKLKDMLEDDVDEKYYLSESRIQKIANWRAYQKPFEKVQGKNSIVPTLTARGAGEEHSGMIVYSENLEGTTNLQEECLKVGLFDDTSSNNFAKGKRDYGYKNEYGTLKCRPKYSIYKNTDLRIRKLTPKECWRLMGFDDEDFEKAAFKKETSYIEGGSKCNAKLKIVNEKQRHLDMETYVLCTTNDMLDMETPIRTKRKKSIENENNEKMQNVNIAIEMLGEVEQKECVTNIIKCGENTTILYTLMGELDQHHMAIIELGKRDKASIEKYMKITLEENLNPMKLYTISTLIEQIIKSKIYTCIVQKANIQGNIAIIEDCVKNLKMMKLLNLKMEYTTRLNSDTMLYKQAGNSIVVNVLEAIFDNLLQEYK